MSASLLDQISDLYSSYLYDSSDFTTKNVIGKGGSGTVYSSLDAKTNKLVAIKELNIKDLSKYGMRRYTTEIQTMVSCHSPFLVPFVGFTKNYPYSIITEYLQNGSLSQCMKEDKGERLTPTALSRIVLGIAMGIKYLHEKHIIHRDLKPSNILLDENLFPKIGDMGISRFCDDVDPSPKTNKLGTPSYTAPEVLKDNNYDNKVDIFSFGMLLYYICEGKSAFSGVRTFQEYYTIVYVQNQRPEFKKTSDVLKTLIQRCWDNDPAMRPKASELVDYLKENANDLFPGSEPNQITAFLKLSSSESKKQAKFDTALDEEHLVLAPKPTIRIISDSSNFSGNSTFDNTCNSSGDHSSNGQNDDSLDSLNSLDLTSSTQTQGNDTLLAALKNPDSPEFDEALEYCKTKLSPSECSDVVSTFVSYFYNGQSTSDEVKDKILVTGLRMIYRDRKFLEYLGAKEFMKYLPLSGKLVKRTIVIVSLVFLLKPELLGYEHAQAICKLLEEYPSKIIPLFYHYANKSGELENPSVKSLVEISHHFVDKPQGFDIVRCLYIFYVKGDIAQEGKTEIINTISLFLRSSNYKNVIISYKVLLAMNIDLSIFDTNLLISHLKDMNLWGKALSALLRLQKIDVNADLVDTLIATLSYDQPDVSKSWLILYRIAEIPQSSQLFMTNDKWLNFYTKYPKECFNLFIILFSNPLNRDALSRKQNFCNLLNSVINLNDKEYTDGVITILLRCQITEETVHAYSNSSLLRAILYSCSILNDPLLQYKGMVLLERISRNGIYTREFLEYLDIMISLLSNQEYYVYAIVALTSMSFHKQCSDVLKKNQSLINYFETVTKSSKFSAIANKFLSFVKV